MSKNYPLKTTSQYGIDFIKRHEGFRSNAYQDIGGVWTIGYGHTRDVKKFDAITLADGEELLRKDLIIYETAVNRYVTREMTQSNFDAFVSFTYNVGIGAFKRSTLLRKFNNREEAASEFFRWNKVKGKTVLGLTRRREAEHELFHRL